MCNLRFPDLPTSLQARMGISIELNGKIFVGKGGNKNEARNPAVLKRLHESGFEI